MKKLLKKYNLNSDIQYFELIIDLFSEQKHEEAIKLFNNMTKINKKNMVWSLFNNYLGYINTVNIKKLLYNI